MKLFANVMIKDEGLMLSHVYPYWKEYPVDKWVFYNDNSTDNTEEVIHSLFGNKAIIFNDKLDHFNEAHNRSRMFEYSRDQNADFVMSIDADEFMSHSLLENLTEVLNVHKQYDIDFYWFNVVESIKKMRQDPMYVNNFRIFFAPIQNAGKFNLQLNKYHSHPRLPATGLTKVGTKDMGFIHLQSINRRFYALKQLWYKHFEFKTWNHPIDYINSRYDPVVNGLNFSEIDTPDYIINGIEFDPSLYNEIEKQKGYKKYILDNLVPELATFGQEYLEKR